MTLEHNIQYLIGMFCILYWFYRIVMLQIDNHHDAMMELLETRYDIKKDILRLRSEMFSLLKKDKK